MTIVSILTTILILLGLFFFFAGTVGILRLPDFYTRLHGPTKATTLGAGCLLLASALFFSLHSEGFSLHEVLVSLFLFITAPISAHLLAKLALHQKLPSVVPLPKDQGQDPPPSQL